MPSKNQQAEKILAKLLKSEQGFNSKLGKISNIITVMLADKNLTELDNIFGQSIGQIIKNYLVALDKIAMASDELITALTTAKQIGLDKALINYKENTLAAYIFCIKAHELLAENEAFMLYMRTKHPKINYEDELLKPASSIIKRVESMMLAIKALNEAGYKDEKAQLLISGMLNEINNSLPEVEIAGLRDTFIFDKISSSAIGTYTTENENLVESLLTEEAKKILYSGTKESTTARENFLNHIKILILNHKKNPSNKDKTISLEELLGTKGLELYLLALAEERDSKDYRTELANKSIKLIKGVKFTNPMLAHTGGGSGTGKTKGSKAGIKHVAILNHCYDENFEGQYFAFIDGGIEREISQVRKLPLQLASLMGYKGIQNLHEHTKLGAKEIIKAILKVQTTIKDSEAPLHGVNIDTFAESYAKSFIPFSENKAYIDMRDFKTQNREQIFFTTSPDPNVSKDLSETARRLGESRAWRKANVEFLVNHLSLNWLPTHESKEYSAGIFGINFMAGIKASEDAKAYLKKLQPNTKCYKIINDLVFLIQDEKNNTWKRCEQHEQHQLFMPYQAFVDWQNNNDSQSPASWWSDNKDKYPIRIEEENPSLKSRMEAVNNQYSTAEKTPGAQALKFTKTVESKPRINKDTPEIAESNPEDNKPKNPTPPVK